MYLPKNDKAIILCFSLGNTTHFFPNINSDFDSPSEFYYQGCLLALKSIN